MIRSKECRFVLLIVFLLVINTIFSTSSVYAYDLTKDHKVNLYINDADKIAQIQKTIYQQLKYWKMTDAGASGVIGNIMAESGCDYTRTQSNVPWSGFKVGYVGIGLTQWTYPTRQQQLFDIADSKHKQWTDLEVQLALLKQEFSTGYDIFFTSNDVDACSDYMLNVYEKPAVRNTAARRELSNTIYNQYKGTKAKNYAGSLSDNNSNMNDRETDESEDSEDSEKEGGSNADSNVITSELDLIGMPSLSVLSEKQNEITLPTTNELSIGEAYSVSMIGDNISFSKRVISYENARVLIVFIGMCLIVYSILLLVSLMFDRVNTFIDISLIGIISFGVLDYRGNIVENDYSEERVSAAHIIIVVVVVLVIGLVIVSGAVLPFMMNLVYGLISQFM